MIVRMYVPLSGRCAAVPTEAKNRVTNTAVRGVTSARICVAKGDSASTIPAANAPSDGENPRVYAPHAAPMLAHTAMTTGSSRLPDKAAPANTLGSTYLDRAHAATTNAITSVDRKAISRRTV